MAFFEFEDPGKTPIRFTIPLDFPEEDTQRYPWLCSTRDRFYRAERPLDRGGFSVPYIGYPCDQNGVRIPGSDWVVIKFPNLGENRDSGEIDDRLRQIQSQSINEWALVRKKLLDCKQANPIFDIGSVWTRNPLREIFVTVQPYLSHATPLDKWLVEQRKRQEIVVNEKGNREDNWRGLSTPDDWLNLATIIGDGLVEIHRRRVIHGDIWPPNIYLTKDTPTSVIFIDFGESFVVTPAGESKAQRNHAYRAPERERAEYVSTEQVDVYSFGKLLLYLAIGLDYEIPRGNPGKPLSGHRRRHFVRNLLFERNKILIASNPWILDIISKCTTFDPVDRPTILDVLNQLHKMSKPNTKMDFVARLESVAQEAKSHGNAYRSVFTRLIDNKVEEVERLIESCLSDMVAIRGTRDELISALVVLFSELHEGDSWSTLTTTAMWQQNGLGLDGRYATATFEAIRRKASVHRSYVVSVEELGTDWCANFALHLKTTGLPELVALSDSFDTAIAQFRVEQTKKGHIKRSEEFMRIHRDRLLCVLESLDSMINLWNLKERVFPERFTRIRAVSGLFIGLLPVETIANIRELRAVNPVSLMYVANRPIEDERWLLVMTDIRGRNEYDSGATTLPQLLGVKVFRSKLGYPKDRVLAMETAMSKCANIGGLIHDVYQCALSVEPKPASESTVT